ncbi:MAG TPA: hypothetical protein VIQ30_11030 [Pseudonocardia sp.]
MTEWLTAGQAAALVDTSADPAAADWVGAVAAAVDYVSGPEGKRRDLWSTDPVPVYAATAMVKLGTAMLANRWYARLRTPMGVSQNAEFGGTEILRQDPDIAKMLGIGTEGVPVFGGARSAELDALEALIEP